jgi:hypothetical protein
MKHLITLSLLVLTLPETVLAAPNPTKPGVKRLASCQVEMLNRELTIEFQCDGYTFKQVDANHQTYTFIQLDYKGNPYGNYVQAHLVRNPCAGNNGFEIETATYHPAEYSALKSPITNVTRSIDPVRRLSSIHFCNPWTDDGRKMNGEGYSMGSMVKIRTIVNKYDVDHIRAEFKASDDAKALARQHELD